MTQPGFNFNSGGTAVGTSSQPSGSGKKRFGALGTEGSGFSTHVILVHAGEDIADKIVAFAREVPRKVCVFSVNGAVTSVLLKQNLMSGGAPVSYEGRFEIMSLVGSFLFEEGDSGLNNGLSITLTGLDDRIFGGVVAGKLIAATRVQVDVGSFVTKKILSTTTFSDA